MPEGVLEMDWYEYKRGWKQRTGGVIEEALVSIHVNGQELATLMATPQEQDYLAVGFLKNEGFIEDVKEIKTLQITENGCCVDVWLSHAISEPDRVIITSGCGGGVTFDDPSVGIQPLDHNLEMAPEVLFELIRQIHSPDSLRAQVRGVHSAGLADEERVLLVAEDVGRHNTIDKIQGACMLQGIDPAGKILLVTGRVSSEMLRKSARMGCPIVASRNSPTAMSIEMARAWNIALVGYVRRGRMRVYSHPWRIKKKEPAKSDLASLRGDHPRKLHEEETRSQ
jgi:FdhD protein